MIDEIQIEHQFKGLIETNVPLKICLDGEYIGEVYLEYDN
jgi:hypothetical protein